MSQNYQKFNVKDNKSVAIFGQLLPGSAGGIETNLLCLLKALAAVPGHGGEVVIGPGGASNWLLPHLAETQSVFPCSSIRCDIHAEQQFNSNRSVWSRLINSAKVRLGRGNVSAFSDYGNKLSQSLKKQGVKVIHFPYQRYFPSDLPFIFEPWDLQHIHLPEFFSSDEIAFREYLYRRACTEASLIVTATRATKNDLIHYYSIPTEKIAVIPRGVGEDLTSYPLDDAHPAIEKLGIPARFAIYPAKTWPHKNHHRLFLALSFLKEQGIEIPLVCTGKPVDSTVESIKHELEAMGLSDSVFFTDFVDNELLGKLYSCAEMMVFPSLFEGLGIPVLEAMRLGVPLALSNASCLPEVAGDAALYFDPYSHDDIAAKMLALWTNDALQEDLKLKGIQQISNYQWPEAAQLFRLCYKKLMGDKLSIHEKQAFDKLVS